MTPAITTAGVLRGAREFLTDESHWFKGWWSPSGSSDSVHAAERVCLVGALVRAAGNVVASVPAWQVLRDRLRRIPADFNDDPKTTHADVLAALDGAIASIEGTA